ncbi:hypothetical protein [Spiribacter roseus]|uniref:DUF4402 domain-containing protein n=1 Tax=Spiribacter roseus TaxID=1855875 RepID=A0ABV3RZJ8_9GAMM
MKHSLYGGWAAIATLCCTFVTAATAAENCANINIRTERMLDLGTLRALPEVRGFLQLDPGKGISVSAHGVTHAGPSGSAEVIVIGPVSAEVRLRVDAHAVSEHDNARLTLVELIVRSGALHQRLPPDGADFTIDLPSHGNAEGQARRKVQFGAVMRFRDAHRSEQALYRLIASCQ